MYLMGLSAFTSSTSSFSNPLSASRNFVIQFLPRYSIGFLSVRPTGDFSLILKRDGTVWAAGGNVYGQLGGNSTEHCGERRNGIVQQPVPCQPTAMHVAVLGNNNAQVIAGGTGFTLVPTNMGSVWAMGNNVHGQLGIDPVQHPVRSHVEVTLVGSDNVQLAAGTVHAVVVKSDGRVFAMGATDLTN